ncbi:WG repeat-containing protein [Chryseobacterium sp. P1-3]|uniref:WG repeat-containing protein n=1 Tax=Chryseobacterium sp. (strain P1-3) TaxID=1517683 RepID=UPI000A599E79|nr:WG repeat-containing protein [Chryseobacterium sp. P1-3]
MAHRLYVYNIDSKTGEQYPYYLGEWNYEIPELLLPLFSCDPRAKGKLLYFDKINGVERLKSFYQLLGEHYQLLYKKAYYEPVNKMFEMLDNLPYDTFVINGWDVFNMSDEKHSDQARNWVFEIKERSKLYDKAMAKQDLGWLEKEIITRSGYGSFLEMLETDWIDYGLGYWNEDLYKDISETFEDNGLWGLKDKKGNIITPPVYEEIFAFSEEGIAVAQKNGKYGYLRNDGKVLIECIYEEAYDSLFIGNKNYGIIEIDQKCGLLNIETGEIVIPCEYEDLEMLRHVYLFNAKKEDKFYLIDVSNKRVIEEGFDEPFEFNYSGLVYRSLKGTSKKAFYTFEGVFLGEHPEDVLSEIGEGYYWVKPNKFQKKISIIKSDGSLLDTEIDTIMLLDYYTSFAYRKAKKWYIYDIKSGEFRLQTHTIENIHRDWFVQFMKNVFLLSDENGWGLYNAAEDRWLLPSSKEYKKNRILPGRNFPCDYFRRNVLF